MNRKFVSKSNFVLRRVLNKDENIDILKELIELILEIKIETAKINPYLENRKDFLPSEENFGIADLRIKTIENEEFNIGIQMIDGEHIFTKMLLYYAQIHVNQLEYDDREIAKTITINILDFIFLKKMDYHSRLILEEEKMSNVIRDNLQMHIIELPKFNKDTNQEITLKEAWISYLKGENIEEALNKSEKIKKLDNLLKLYWREEVME